MAIQKKRRVFSALEVAKICGVVNQTVINWIRADHLKASMTPGGQFRVYPDDLRDFLVANKMRVPEELWELLNNEELVVVEDDKVLNNLMTVQLGRAFPNLKIRQAFDGFEAGSLLTACRPKAVVLDLNLPGVDGYEICRRLKTQEDFHNPFVAVVTAGDNPQAEIDSRKAGADAFYLKPFRTEILVETLRIRFGW